MSTNSKGDDSREVQAEASFNTAEEVDVSAADHTVAINDGTARALYVGVTGDIKVDTPNGETVTYTNVPVGFNPISCTKIYNSGTGASGIVAGAW